MRPRAIPGIAQPREVGDGDGRVEDPVDQVRDRRLSLAERRESERLGGEQVEPPAGMEGDVEQGADGLTGHPYRIDGAGLPGAVWTRAR